MSDKVLDLVIVGAGPAGLTASIYAQRAMLDSVVLEQEAVGGQIMLTADVDNYPAVPHTSGFELADAMRCQAEDLGARIVSDQASSITQDPETKIFTVTAAEGTYESKTVILAGGATPRHAGFEGEEKLGGHGVSYCATCDGMFYRNKQVFVIGGGNSALEEALFLTRFASKVTVIVRKDHVRAQAAVLKKIEENEKVEVRYMTSVVKLEGETLPESITFRNNETGEETTETYTAGSFGVFVFVGRVPATKLIEGMADLDERAYAVADETGKTKTPGLFVAGDIREKKLRQIVTATADGANAATAAAEYLGQHIDS